MPFNLVLLSQFSLITETLTAINVVFSSLLSTVHQGQSLTTCSISGGRHSAISSSTVPVAARSVPRHKNVCVSRLCHWPMQTVEIVLLLVSLLKMIAVYTYDKNMSRVVL